MTEGKLGRKPPHRLLCQYQRHEAPGRRAPLGAGGAILPAPWALPPLP